ncbi:hypothetical protein K435DRAFT_781329 [Dendrothele bispora CBS 962.96]|uniref:G-protein coupled receptors family 1 profile domain-containing protein n=1 Tax=Dendrothele bispora (strain CBS 962.96) TaxID=1314807 RepID=A0A4V6T593_DENBC|nr:hypothetical protein K435DRAFT_781329 [Dendrothele bispora CBS 962.96]
MASTPSTSSHYLTDTQILSVQHAIIRIGCEFLFFGIHALLYFISTYLLFYKGIRLVKARILLLILTSIMLLSSLGVIIIDMMMVLRQILTYGRDAPSTKELNLELRLASNVLMRVNFLLGDVIVVWRTWVVWPHNWKIRLLLAICMLGTIGAIVGNGTKAAIDYVRDTPVSSTYSLVMTLPPLVTNLVATLLIALKVWEYRRNIKSSISSARSTTRVEQMLILLVESGFVYCAVWLIILIAGFDVMSSANNILILGLAVSLTGIYPTIIVILVSLERSHADTIFSTSITDGTAGRGEGGRGRGQGLRDSKTMAISQPIRFDHSTSMMTATDTNFSDSEGFSPTTPTSPDAAMTTMRKSRVSGGGIRDGGGEIGVERSHGRRRVGDSLSLSFSFEEEEGEKERKGDGPWAV